MRENPNLFNRTTPQFYGNPNYAQWHHADTASNFQKGMYNTLGSLQYWQDQTRALPTTPTLESIAQEGYFMPDAINATGGGTSPRSNRQFRSLDSFGDFNQIGANGITPAQERQLALSGLGRTVYGSQAGGGTKSATKGAAVPGASDVMKAPPINAAGRAFAARS